MPRLNTITPFRHIFQPKLTVRIRQRVVGVLGYNNPCLHPAMHITNYFDCGQVQGTSGAAVFLFVFVCMMLSSLLCVPIVWKLCNTGSLFKTSNSTPAGTSSTCGIKIHFCWSIWIGLSPVSLGNPLGIRNNDTTTFRNASFFGDKKTFRLICMPTRLFV